MNRQTLFLVLSIVAAVVEIVPILVVMKSPILFLKGVALSMALPVLALFPQIHTPVIVLRNIGFAAVLVIKALSKKGLIKMATQTELAADDILFTLLVFVCVSSPNIIDNVLQHAVTSPRGRRIVRVQLACVALVLSLLDWMQKFATGHPISLNPYDGSLQSLVVLSAMSITGSATFNAIYRQHKGEKLVLVIWTVMVGTHIASATAFYLIVSFFVDLVCELQGIDGPAPPVPAHERKQQ